MTPEAFKALTPLNYKALYENLMVPLDGGKALTVSINQYRLIGRNVNEAVRDKFLATLHDAKAEMNLQVYSVSELVDDKKRNNPAQVGPLDKTRLAVMARYAFGGKGAPEHCQLVLQLADRWGLAPKGLQAYADDALGLDCNSFVGNYIWHVRREKPWDNGGFTDKDKEGPDSAIGNFAAGKTAVTKWDDMKSATTYLLAEVNTASGQVIDGGKGKEGHIALTEPNRVRVATGKVPAGIYVVESTAGHQPGLCDSWYSLQQMNSKFKGVFDIKREGMMAGHTDISFRIYELL